MLVTVDTGGTKTLVASFSEDGSIAKRTKFPTPRDENEYIAQLQEAIKSITADEVIDAIVVGLPGRIVDGGILAHAGNIGWRNFDIRPALHRTFSCPILVENDANLAGLAEARSLTKTPRVCLYITISTGIGTGIIVNGMIDPNFSQSEGGQIMLEHDGRLVEWERFASGKAIHTTYNKLASEITNKRVWYQICKNIAQGIVVLVPVIRPDVVIIGGSIGTYFDRYNEKLNDFVKEHLHGGNVPTIIQAQHPEEAVIYGCYFYALDTLTPQKT